MSLSTRVGKGSSRKVRNERATIGYGRAVTVLGRLTTVDGSPLTDQEIVLAGTERRAGATAADLARVRTDTGGRFRVTLPAGPSRDLTVRYPGLPASCTASAPSACASRPARRSTPRRASLRGQGAIRFSGRLRALGTALPPGGKIVDLQASQRGRWSTVATTAPAAPPAPGAPSHVSAAPRAATRSACVSAAKRCSPTNWVFRFRGGTRPLRIASFWLWCWPWWSPSGVRGDVRGGDVFGRAGRGGRTTRGSPGLSRTSTRRGETQNTPRITHSSRVAPAADP